MNGDPGQDSYTIIEESGCLIISVKGSTLNTESAWNNHQWVTNALPYVPHALNWASMAFNGFNGNSTQFNTPQIVQNVCNTIHDTSHNLASIKMFNELRSTLMGADRILICGHSRGGIIAILLAIMCVQDNCLKEKIAAVITFASPKFRYTLQETQASVLFLREKLKCFVLENDFVRKIQPEEPCFFDCNTVVLPKVEGVENPIQAHGLDCYKRAVAAWIPPV